MLPQGDRHGSFSFHINPNRSLDFYPASSLFRADSNVRVETIAGYGETRTASLSFLPDSNTKKYRHPATSSARKSPKSDHRRRYGFR